MDWYCYIIISSDNHRTYIGATNDVYRRLDKHNGKISGGAKATRMGRPWKHICYIGKLGHVDALRLEWRLKKRLCPKKNKLKPCWGNIKVKMQNIIDVLNLERWTSTSPLAKERPLSIIWVDKNHRPQNFHENIPKYVCEKQEDF